MLVILPLTLRARAVFLPQSSRGWGDDCLRPREMRLVFGIDVEDRDRDLLADGQELLGMDELARPRQVGDMDQAFDALLELDEGAEIGQADHLAGDLLAGGVFLLDVLPGVFGELLKAEGDLLVPFVEIQDDHLDLLADGEELRGMAGLPPGHVRDVEQTLDAADVDEGAEAGQRAHLPLELLALDQVAEDPLLLFLALVLEEELPGEDGVLGLPVELDHLELERLADELVRVPDHPDVGVRFREEGVDADVDGEAAPGPVLDPAGDPAVAGVGLLELVDGPDRVRALLGQDEIALLGVRPLHVASISSPGISFLISSSSNSSTGMTPSDLNPMSRSTLWGVTLMTRPRTILPAEISLALNWYLSSSCS